MLDQFKRVDFGDWALLVGAVSIILLLAVFVTISIRSFILPAAALDHISGLPLDEPDSNKSTDNPIPPTSPS